MLEPEEQLQPQAEIGSAALATTASVGLPLDIYQCSIRMTEEAQNGKICTRKQELLCMLWIQPLQITLFTSRLWPSKVNCT